MATLQYSTRGAFRAAMPVVMKLMLLALLGACGGRVPPTRFEANPGLRQEGLASYYANSLAGRPTASGEPYRPERLTAAHRALPLGTIIRVRRIDRGGRATGPSVEVKVNDRGPFAGKRILDLSYAAARQLGMLRAGVIRVELEVLSAPSRTR